MSNQHNAYLKAMGIDVWVERTPSIPAIKARQQTEPELEPLAPESISKPEKNLNIESLDWPALRSIVAECQNCELAKTRTQTVFGTGKQTASMMIIGDAPNDEDDKQGDVFSGQAGKLLNAMLKAMGFQRNDVYISNLVKCRRPENQELSIENVTACESYLIRQIKLVQPDLILALGSITAQRLLKSKSTMGRLRGQLHYIDGVNVPIIVSFEPAYLLRSANEKRKAWEDLQMAMKQLTTIEPLMEESASTKENNE